MQEEDSISVDWPPLKDHEGVGEVSYVGDFQVEEEVLVAWWWYVRESLWRLHGWCCDCGALIGWLNTDLSKCFSSSRSRLILLCSLWSTSPSLAAILDLNPILTNCIR